MNRFFIVLLHEILRKFHKNNYEFVHLKMSLGLLYDLTEEIFFFFSSYRLQKF